MNLPRMALRTVLYGKPPSWMPMLALAGAACALARGAGLAAVLPFAACVIASHTAIHALARRRELATLRALGMPAPALVWILALEALWITFLGTLAGWGIGSVLLPLPAAGASLLDMAALPVTALLAAFPAAIRAARRDIAASLALLPPGPSQ